ncbi:hypothetical protein JA13_142 [Dickeya phage vB_DsoM_JA13]|uniref:Uncharacterized protein n=1 Tax=Dickeya phage vB_DsoM_JA13 TaxID=2283030 RepID=A0A384ZWD4_9CAUD|nr:hypothetical protein JA13_142 [Dickeya phage vB_DsoM_JA13]
MGKFIKKSGYVDNQKMWKDIVADLVANGFTLVSANGTAGSSMPTVALNSFVIEATEDVDVLAGVSGSQRWRIAGQLAPLSTRLNVATPDQISDTGTVAKIGQTVIGQAAYPIYSGSIGKRRTSALPAQITQDADKNSAHATYFWHRGIVNDQGTLTATPAYAGTMCFQDTDADSMIFTDPASTPMTYHLSISDHGLALHISVEGADDFGCRQAWLVIQRAINRDGSVVTDGKAPLFCMYSVNGGGSENSNDLIAGGIQRFTVRETDVNAPTAAVSAVQHSADAFAVINPLQQVAFSEDNKFDFRLPQGFNSHRYSYPYEIDMVGYASADVISNGVQIAVQVYNEMDNTDPQNPTPKKRTYQALSANSPKNTGMRIFLLAAGGGV